MITYLNFLKWKVIVFVTIARANHETKALMINKLIFVILFE
jgi:hypothetical protein